MGGETFTASPQVSRHPRIASTNTGPSVMKRIATVDETWDIYPAFSPCQNCSGISARKIKFGSSIQDQRQWLFQAASSSEELLHARGTLFSRHMALWLSF